jgi:hypothetical protein
MKKEHRSTRLFSLILVFQLFSFSAFAVQRFSAFQLFSFFPQ